jgi:excinuclease ABC subunit C
MLHLTDISHIPHQPGVYLFHDDRGNILYIGKAKNLYKRVKQYFAHGSVWKQDMLMQAYHVDFMITQSESECLYLEDNLIKKHQPPFNRLLKGDNSYVYIKITKEPFAQIFVTHNRRQDGALYIWPKHHRTELSNLLHYLRQVLKRRGCKPKQFAQGVLCNDYMFGLCRGRCVYAKLWHKHVWNYTAPARLLGLDIQDDWHKDRYIHQYGGIIGAIQALFDGDDRQIRQQIFDQIQECITTQNFEYAQILKKVYSYLDLFIEKQTVIIDDTQVTGYRYLIRPSGDQYIICVIKCRQGKIIDIIRFHQDKNDQDIDSIIWQIGRECETIRWNHSDDQWRFWSSLTPRIAKKYYKTLARLMSDSLDSYVYAQVHQDSTLLNNILHDLQSKYDLMQYPYRIECIDISHLQSNDVSGGLSCMQSGILWKKWYRHYKLHTGNDDYRSMTEVLKRRLYRQGSEWSHTLIMPDLMILDGWIGQLHIVDQMIQTGEWDCLNQIQFVALGKWKARSRSGKNAGNHEFLLVRRQNGHIDQYELDYDHIDRILIKLRDEAHRFANRYRKIQMSKQRSG